jgi:3-hydroxyacyl-CoA dehydrogenase
VTGSMVTASVQGTVKVLCLNRAPVNALDKDLMQALSQALHEAEADTGINAVVLTAEGNHFSAGLDVSELGKVQGSALGLLTAQIEAMKKPVVATLHGNVLGGALELVLACHGRVAHQGARLGFPEIALGLLPVAGSTQRLPRLVGGPIALTMLLEGAPLPAVEALAMGLLDAVVETKPIARALALAADLAEQDRIKTADRRDGLRDPVAFQSAIAETRKRIEGYRLPAPGAIVECVEAALLLPFDMGLRLEQSLGQDIADSDEAAALRHAFLAERRALYPPAEVMGVASPKLTSLAILGTSGLAPDVALQALVAGLRVRLVAADRAGLTAALQTIAARQEAAVLEKRQSPQAREADWARLTGVLASDGAGEADLFLATPDAPKMAEVAGTLVGLGGRGTLVLHASPASGGLAEISASPTAPVDLLAVLLAFARRLGWRAMIQGPGPSIDQRLRHILSRAIAVLESKGHERQTIAATLASFGLGAGARMRLPEPPARATEILDFCLAALMNEGARILSENAAPRASAVDAASLISGLFPRWEGGPLYMADRKGLMALRAELRARADASPQLFTPAPILDVLISEGRNFGSTNRG